MLALTRTQPTTDGRITNRATIASRRILRRFEHEVIVPDPSRQSGSDRPRIANGRGSPAKW